MQIFKFKDQYEVRLLQGKDSKWLFDGTDVCTALDYSDTTQALNKLSEEDNEKVLVNLQLYQNMTSRSDSVKTTESDEHQQNTKVANLRQGPTHKWFVTEPGLYRLICNSTKPAAKDFQKWVFHEVLPAIRKTGTYSVSNATLSLCYDEFKATELFALSRGYNANQSALVADKVVKQVYGYSPLTLIGQSLISDKQDVLLTPTQIGKKIGQSAINDLFQGGRTHLENFDQLYKTNLCKSFFNRKRLSIYMRSHYI